MKRLLYIIVVSIFTFGFNKGSDKKISIVLAKHHWKIICVTDLIHGQKTNYYNGNDIKDWYPAVQKKLKEFEMNVVFKPDSSFTEYKDKFIDRKDTLNRKWKVKKGILEIMFDPPKSNSHYTPLLYGKLKIIQCNDSVVILKREVIKQEWFRTFELHKL